MHGGVAQDIGQALGETLLFDPQGKLLTESFLDYKMSVASDFPPFRIMIIAVPTAINPLAAKGVGEAGTAAILAATMNAFADALASAGVHDFERPATSYRAWHALQSATQSMV